MGATLRAALGAVIMAAALFGQPHDAQAQGAPTFAQCETAVDEAALRASVTDNARDVLRGAAADVDYDALVLDAWRAARFDRRFERIVDDKIALIRADTSYVSRLADANWPPFAEEMAERAARLIFESQEFETLQETFRREVAKRLEPVFARAELSAGDVAAECVRVYLGARYAEVVRGAFSDALAPESGAATAPDVSGVGGAAAASLGGVVAALLALAFQRAIRRMIARVAQRLVGVIAARMAAWASVIIGAVVLTYEVIAGAEGVFPDIRKELLDPETKTEIRMLVVDELKSVGLETLDSRADAIAAEMVGRWAEFKANHTLVLDLAERAPDFAAYLGGQPPQRFDKLSALVAVLTAEGGDGAVTGALASGVLDRAMRVPQIDSHAAVFAPSGVTLAGLVAWADLAGAAYPDALAFGLPGVVAPDALDRAAVTALLRLDTPEQAQKIAIQPDATRATLLALPPETLRRLARDFSAPAIETLMAALAVVPDASERRLLLEKAIERPRAAAALTDPSVVETIAASRSPGAALGVLLDDAGYWDPFAVARHVSVVLDGEAAALTLVHRYGWGAAVLVGGPLLIGLGLFRSLARLVAPRRRRA